MKISFINLNYSWQKPFSEPPLGFLSVAAVAREIPGTEVSFEDMALTNAPGEHSEFARKLPQSDLYCLSASTREYQEIVDCAEEIKRIYPQSFTAVGGVHFDALKNNKLYWERKIKETPFDIISVGEGEPNIPRILDYVKSNKRKIVVRQEGPFADLNSFPLPARDLLNKFRYFKRAGENHAGEKYSLEDATTLMTSRGCPYSCNFCASPGLHNRSIRFRSRKKVEEEVVYLREHLGISTLKWYDDNFPLNLWSKEQKGLENFLHDSGVFSRVAGRTSDIIARPEILETLYYAGVREIGIGIESAENGVLKLINKKATVADHEKVLKMLEEKGILKKIFLMTGLPGETKFTGEKTIEFLEKTKPDIVNLAIFDPHPGSDIFNNPEKYGLLKISKDWSRHTTEISKNPLKPDDFTYRLSNITIEDMIRNAETIRSWIFENCS